VTGLEGIDVGLSSKPELTSAYIRNDLPEQFIFFNCFLFGKRFSNASFDQSD
jgi:hypothetical protein